jgi:hypothetical protein
MEKLTWGKRLRTWRWWPLVSGVGTGLAGGAVIALTVSLALLPDASESHPATVVLASQVCDQAQAAGWKAVRSEKPVK